MEIKKEKKSYLGSPSHPLLKIILHGVLLVCVMYWEIPPYIWWRPWSLPIVGAINNHREVIWMWDLDDELINMLNSLCFANVNNDIVIGKGILWASWKITKDGVPLCIWTVESFNQYGERLFFPPLHSITSKLWDHTVEISKNVFKFVLSISQTSKASNWALKWCKTCLRHLGVNSTFTINGGYNFKMKNKYCLTIVYKPITLFVLLLIDFTPCFIPLLVVSLISKPCALKL